MGAISGFPTGDNEWTEWVSATSTRNYVLGDPLLDWLDIHGAAHGYLRDDEYPDFDPRTDFTRFLFEQGRRFERAVLECLRSAERVMQICDESSMARDAAAAAASLEAMAGGVPIIYQGVVWDAETRTYGVPDFLVRSDVIARLFPTALTDDNARQGAPLLESANWHYRVVDSKFTTLHLAASGELSNRGSSGAYKVQLYLYNAALGQMQGLAPSESFLLGRGWDQTVKGVTSRGTSCLDRLAPVKQVGMVAGKRSIADTATDATRWRRVLREEGASWQILPRPSRDDLYPDLVNPQDGPWHRAKRLIAEELEDVTLLWQVGVPGRKQAHQADVYSWRDERCSAEIVGITGTERPRVFQCLLDMNRGEAGHHVRPERVTAEESEWRAEPLLEFYVDFETVNDLADDFVSMPQRGGTNMIYMIGCGHLEQGEWQFECFVANELTEAAEAKIVDSWFSHMEEVRTKVAAPVEPYVIHWSPAEVSNFETAYNAAQQRHPDKGWTSPRWFDFLSRVVRAEPVVVRGAMAFGLKAVARALHEHGLITTLWGDGPADGLGAMVGAWWCQEEARRRGVRLIDVELMQEIRDYNEVDCKVMMESIAYLRRNH